MVAFNNRFLESRLVCNNCFRRRRREAIRHRSYKPDETFHERIRWRTSVEDVPNVPASESAVVFCECGVAGPHDRLWDDGDIGTRDRFADLLKAALATASQLGLVERRSEASTVASVAWQYYDAGAHVDAALEEAFDQLPDRPPQTTTADTKLTA